MYISQQNQNFGMNDNTTDKTLLVTTWIQIPDAFCLQQGCQCQDDISDTFLFSDRNSGAPVYEKR